MTRPQQRDSAHPTAERRENVDSATKDGRLSVGPHPTPSQVGLQRGLESPEPHPRDTDPTAPPATTTPPTANPDDDMNTSMLSNSDPLSFTAGLRIERIVLAVGGAPHDGVVIWTQRGGFYGFITRDHQMASLYHVGRAFALDEGPLTLGTLTVFPEHVAEDRARIDGLLHLPFLPVHLESFLEVAHLSPYRSGPYRTMHDPRPRDTRTGELVSEPETEEDA